MALLINAPRPRPMTRQFFRDTGALVHFAADLLGNAVDNSYRRLSGAVTNATVKKGPFGPCYDFATNGRINYARNIVVPDENHTLGLWVNGRTLASGRRALEHNPYTQASGANSLYLSISAIGTGVQISTLSTTGVWQSQAFSTSMLTGRWYFLACTYDKAMSWTHLFLNGKPVSGYSQVRGRFGGAYDIWIGGNANNTNSVYQWDGLISETFCLRRVLSPKEIFAYYENMVRPEYTKLFAGGITPGVPTGVSILAGPEKNTLAWSA